MKGVLTRSIYKYQGLELASGAKVNANEVAVENGKVVMIGGDANVVVKVGEENRSFNFSIYNYGVNGEKTYNLNSVPEGVDGQAIVKEFVDFVESDIV